MGRTTGERQVGHCRRIRFRRINALCLGAAMALGAALMPQPALAASKAAGEAKLPATIDATGTKDVSAQMSDFFASLPPDTRVVFPSRGRFRMEKTLLLNRRTNLTIEGNGSTLFATTPGDAHRANIRVIRGSNVVIRNLVVKGANRHAGTSEAAYVPAKEHQHAIEVRGSDTVVIEHVTALNMYGDFVYLGLDNGLWSKNVTIRNNLFTRNGRQGIAFIAVRNVVVERNYIGDVRRATFDFEPMGNTAGVSDVVIRDNVIGRGRLLFVAAAGTAPVHHVQILRNALNGQSLQMAIRHDKRHFRHAWTIVGNTSDATVGNPLGAAMRIRNVDGLEIAHNRQRFQKGRKMVLASIDASCHVSVHGNDVPGAIGVVRRTGNC